MTTQYIDGHVATGFGRIAEAFRQNFEERGDTGAACAVYQHGEKVVDLWGGRTQQGSWSPNTRSVLFSVSKGITAICLLMASEGGHLDLDAPVADYWPEFSSQGKDRITVRETLAHRAGLIAPAETLTAQDLREWTPVTEVLARQTPLWEPGTAFSYHALTVGWLAGEVLRRVTGMRPSQWLQEKIARPLGLNVSFGTTPDQPDLAYLGKQLPSPEPAPANGVDADLAARVMGMNGAFDGLDLFTTANSTDFLTCEIPAGNLIGNARELARLYAATVGEVDGVRLLKPDTVREARLPLSIGKPWVGPEEGHRWATGFMLDSRVRGMAGPGSFGHDGAGGQLAFAHLEHGLSFAYQTIRPGGIPDGRAEQLCEALRSCL